MKRIFAFPLIVFSLMVVFSSCEKEYTCHCNIVYTDRNDLRTLNTTDNNFQVQASSKDEAKNSCRYYETFEKFQQEEAIVKHDCDIK